MAQNDNEMIMDGIVAYALAKRYTQQFLGTGIINVAIVDLEGTVNLDFLMSDGSHIFTPIDGVLTPQQKADVVKVLPVLNKMLENTEGRVQYDEKTILTEEDISLDQTKQLVKLLSIITIDSDEKGKINNIKFDMDADNDIIANGKKLLYKEDVEFIIKSKYSDLVIPKSNAVAYVLQEEIIGADTFKDGFYVYDQSAIPSLWKYRETTSNFSLKKWQAGEDYCKGEYIVYNYKLYQAKVNVLGEMTFDESKYELIIMGGTTNDGEGLTPEQLILLNRIPSLENNIESHKQNKNNPHEIDVSGLKDTNIVGLLDGQVLSYDLISGEWINKTINVTENGKIKLNASSALDYLENYIDNNTIQVKNNKLVVKTLDGLTLSVTEINGLKTKIDSISSAGMRYTGTVADKATLDALTSVTSGDTKIVLADESQSGKRMTYIYNGTTWEALGEFSVKIRDFTVQPIDLLSEVTGKLPQSNMDLTGMAKTTDLDDYMRVVDFDSNRNGIVDKAETLQGLTKTIDELNKTIGIDNILTTGEGIAIEKDTINNTITIKSTASGGIGVNIDDNNISKNTTFSSEKIMREIEGMRGQSSTISLPYFSDPTV